MRISPARKVAFETLLKLERGLGFAVDLLQGPEVKELKEADRRLATEIVMGTLRWRGELDFQLRKLSHRHPGSLDIEALTALRMAIYQIRFLHRIPPSAAVNDAVELVKTSRKPSAAGFVNAVLRQCRPPESARQAGPQSADQTAPAIRRTVPAWLLARWAHNYGRAASDALARASLRTPTTALRVLGGKDDVPRVREQLESRGIRTTMGKYSPLTLVVESGRIRSLDAAFELGVVIQDEASQLVAGLLGARPGQRVLDLAAAPGIKTSQIAAAMGYGFLVAADRSASRLQIISRLWPRTSRFASPLHRVQLDATRSLPLAGPFDRILADVPCSGTGTLARNPEIKWRIRQTDLARLAGIQAAILRNGLQLLAPGGRLVYSTCSLEPEENEAVLERVLGELRQFRHLNRTEVVNEHPSLENLIDPHGYFRTRPDLHGMDGFFAATIAPKT